jgi:hypothetical protein
VAGAIVDTIEGLKVAYPKLDRTQRRELETARKLLQSE